jgi:sulfur-carrier protein adenylyltransferase/sulfurtransferase
MKHLFNSDEILRYSRQLILPEFNIRGQQALKKSAVLVVGAGGLGSPILLYLAAAGVGKIGVVDFDCVEVSNLQRQVLFNMGDLNQPKSTAAVEKLKRINPNCQFVDFNESLSVDNVEVLFSQFDLIIDGTDNFPARYLINDASYFLSKPLIYGSIYQFEGQVSVFNYAKNEKPGPCYRCLFPEAPPSSLVSNCSEGGVLGVLPGIIGCMQANEAIKVLVGMGEPLSGKLFMFDALNFDSKTMVISKDPGCSLCSKHSTINQVEPIKYSCSNKTNPLSVKEFSSSKLKSMMDDNADFQLIDIRAPFEAEIASIGGELISLNEIQQNIHASVGRLSSQHPVIFYCRDGSRSRLAVSLFEKEFGMTNLYNLHGGIQSWSLTIDDGVPFY